MLQNDIINYFTNDYFQSQNIYYTMYDQADTSKVINDIYIVVIHYIVNM